MCGRRRKPRQILIVYEVISKCDLQGYPPKITTRSGSRDTSRGSGENHPAPDPEDAVNPDHRLCYSAADDSGWGGVSGGPDKPD